ncbi:MAG: hypothetical protein HC887_00790, partial [Desulfobacteraceae bacterium]|nr:hypothetical protein [Desulfobacteraceae bacterium]
MDKTDSETKAGKLMILSGVGWTLVLLLALLYGLQFNLGDAFGNRAKKSDILSRMRINMLKSVELEKSAVMAVSDKESEVFAQQSLKAANDTEHDLHELSSMSEAAEERRLVREFLDCWKNFREIDKMLLDFAVQNTNLKASDLSGTKCAESVRRFEVSIINLTEIYPEDIRITKLAYQAIMAALKIHNLQSPHIDAADDVQMNDIESLMISEADRIRTALNEIAGIADMRGQNSLDSANAAFAEFMTINTEVVKLSRQNSNIRS